MVGRNGVTEVSDPVYSSHLSYFLLNGSQHLTGDAFAVCNWQLAAAYIYINSANWRGIVHKLCNPHTYRGNFSAW